jgi:hypothetical protein
MYCAAMVLSVVGRVGTVTCRAGLLCAASCQAIIIATSCCAVCQQPTQWQHSHEGLQEAEQLHRCSVHATARFSWLGVLMCCIESDVPP